MGFVSLFLTGSIFASLAQKQGVIADAVSHAPLSYVNIHSKTNPTIGTYSNMDGKFTIPSSIKSDTLVFSLMGYRTFYVATPKKVLPDTIFLHEEPLQLATVLVKPTRKQTVRLGSSSSAGNLSLGSNLPSWHSELAAFFTSKSDIPLYIESLEVYLLLYSGGSDEGYVRVNLYSVGNNLLPAAPLINRSFLIKVDAKDRRGKWYVVDISGLMLKVPTEGLFVGVEFLPVVGSSLTSRNPSLRFGKEYPLRAVERIGGVAWREATIQKYKPGSYPLIRLNLSN